jgi:hypothetical protein
MPCLRSDNVIFRVHVFLAVNLLVIAAGAGPLGKVWKLTTDANSYNTHKPQSHKAYAAGHEPAATVGSEQGRAGSPAEPTPS